MPRNNDYNRGQNRNSQDYDREGNRSRTSYRNDRDRDIDSDYERSRFENERYEDPNSNYTDNYGARGGRHMSGRHDQDRGSRTEWRDQSQSWNRATDISQNDDNRSSRNYRSAGHYAQDDNFSARGEMRHPQRGDYSEPRGRSSEGRGQFSQRDNGYSRGGGDYFENNNRDTATGGGYGLGRDQFSESSAIRDPYSRGGRVYSQGDDRYMRGTDDSMESDRSSNEGGMRRQGRGYSYDGGVSEQGRGTSNYGTDQRGRTSAQSNYSYSERSPSDREDYRGRDRSAAYGGAYSENQDDFGSDHEQNPGGKGRYGSRGSSGTRNSNNAYLDESDDNYNYAYGSDDEEKRRKKRRASGSDDETQSERMVTPGRARFGHGSEIGDHMDSSTDDETETATGRRGTSGRRSSQDKKSKTASPTSKSMAESKSASAKSKSGKRSAKDSTKSSDNQTGSPHLVQ